MKYKIIVLLKKRFINPTAKFTEFQIKMKILTLFSLAGGGGAHCALADFNDL